MNEEGDLRQVSGLSANLDPSMLPALDQVSELSPLCHLCVHLLLCLRSPVGFISLYKKGKIKSTHKSKKVGKDQN